MYKRQVSYTFEEGTVLASGAYLAIAADPEGLRNAHELPGEGWGLLPIVGPFEGELSNKGELLRLVDTRGNPADEVRYHDGGLWPKWADGGGSSLELLDPNQDNSVASAWEDSDESTKSQWEEISYTISYATQSESEFQIRMMGAGEVLVDDIQVRRGNTQYIRNGSFESNTSSWIIQGNHIQSRRTTEDSTAGNACLRIVATGDGDVRVNRIETETSRRMTSGAHQSSLQARWMRGAHLIFFSCYRQFAGCQHPHWLQIPYNLGSPGMVNSVASNNLGPVLSEVIHQPAVPAAGQEVIEGKLTDVYYVVKEGARAHVYDLSSYADNAAVDTTTNFDPNVKDGRSTRGLTINKTNWANTLDQPPFQAYNVTCGLTFTFGGLRINDSAQVLDTGLEAIPGLYAAGELVGGLFYGNYPGGTGLMAGAVFGKLAGDSAGFTSTS